MARGRYYISEPQLNPLHVVLGSPITLPTGTSPQDLTTVDIGTLISNTLDAYRNAGLLLQANGPVHYILAVHMHFGRSGTSAATVYFGATDGLNGRTGNIAGGSNRSISAFCGTNSDAAKTTITLRGAQSSAVGWRLEAYTIYIIPYTFGVNTKQWKITSNTIYDIGNSNDAEIYLLTNAVADNTLISVPTGVTAINHTSQAIFHLSGFAGAANITLQQKMLGSDVIQVPNSVGVGIIVRSSILSTSLDNLANTVGSNASQGVRYLRQPHRLTSAFLERLR